MLPTAPDDTMKLKTFPLVLLLTAACSPDPARPPVENEKPEVFENASALVDEGAIRAALDGTTAEILIPIQKKEGDVLEGLVRVRLVDVSVKEEPVLADLTAGVEQREAEATHRLRVSGIPDQLERPDAAAIVVDWSVSTEDGELRGKKSLYAALGKIEVQLRGATEMPAGGTTTLRAIVRDPDSGAAYEGARVLAALIQEETKTTLAEGNTDARGELALELGLPSGVDAGSVRIEVKHGDTEAWTTTNLRTVKERKLSLSTDKTIYKPGQTLHLRTLALHTTEKTPLAAEEVVFEALDGKGNKVFKRRATTDDWGVAAMDVPTDSQVNEGEWTLRAEIDGARIEQKIPVVRYNLPKLKVAVSTEQAYARPGDTIRGRIAARYLFGLPVTGAQVEVVAKLSDGTQLTTETGQTDAEGGFAFELPVSAGLSSNAIEDGREQLAVEATVIDTAGQTEAGGTSLVLTKAELVIRAVAEGKALVPGVDNTLYVLVSDPLGRPLVADVDVTGAGPLGGKTTDADGLAVFELLPEGDELSLSISATDGAGRTHARAVTLPVDPEALLVRTDRAIYRAGDTAVVTVRSAADAQRVFLDVFRGAAGLDALSLSLENGVAEAHIPVTEEMGGVLLFDAFLLGGSGRTFSGSTRALVATDDRLTVRMTPSQTTFGPGDEAEVTVEVQDPAGNPRAAALGLYGVDEAVFALGGEPKDDLFLTFNLDDRVLPSDATAFGRTPSDLFGPDSAETKAKVARLMFASTDGDLSTVGVDYNSIREELPAVRDALKAKVTRDMIRFLETLIPLAKDGGITQENAERQVVRNAERVVDAFGRYYKAEIGDDWRWMELTMTSAGADEQLGTDDDVSHTIWYDFIFWANPGDIDEDNAFQRGGVAVDDAAAGGPPPAPENQADPNAANKSTGDGGAKVRSDFRETIVANPSLITDAGGRATLRFPLADSITTWRLTAQASTKDGMLGTGRLGFRTFQRFFVDFTVPTKLTRGDEIELPAVVYNYLDEPQDVTVTLEPAPWMTILSGGAQSITLGPSEVRSVKFRIRAEQAGAQSLTLRGAAGSITDALVRTAEVRPDGTPDEMSFSDELSVDSAQKSHTISVPADAIEGGTRVVLSLTPGFAAQAVQGMEGMIQEPHGCFEQTTSTAWPNTLVTLYLDTTGQMTPELRAEILDVVTRGYQRLLTFESPTGGFNWWGDADPGNRILSAIMLWHLKDLEQLIEIDEDVRDRTLRWLLDQQQADGHWASGDALHAGNEVLGTSDARTTAFIAWALAHTGWADDATGRAATWLEQNAPGEEDLYANALAMNALAMTRPDGAVASQLFARLDAQKDEDAEGRVKWPTEAPSWTGAGGDTAAIETTGLVAYGLINARAYPENAAGAMRFLVANKDAVGSWYNTQATMNALRALLAAASPQGADADGAVELTVNGQPLAPITVTPDTGDVFRRFDITEHLATGDNTVEVALDGTGKLTYQLTRVAYRPNVAPAGDAELSLDVTWSDTELTVGEPVQADLTATYNGEGQRDQVLVRLGRAPGFSPFLQDLDALQASGVIARYEVDDTHVTLYMMGLASGEARTVSMRFVPTLAAEAQAPTSEIYVYYEPTIRSEVGPQAFVVAP